MIPFFKQSYSNISEHLLKGSGYHSLNNNLEWGILENNIGYLHIHSFAGFLSKTYSRHQQIDSLKYQMRRIIRQFKNTEALIIDVSFNFGGYDASALSIARFFATDSTFAYSQEVYNDEHFM